MTGRWTNGGLRCLSLLLLFAVATHDAAAQEERAVRENWRLELAAGSAKAGPGDPTPSNRFVWGPSFDGSLYGRWNDNVMLGLEGAWWWASEGDEHSHTNFLLAGLRYYLTVPHGISFMAGVGRSTASFANFQHADTIPGEATRLAIGGGVGYEPVGIGPVALGGVFRYFNMIGGPRRPGSFYGRMGNSVMLQVGATLAIRPNVASNEELVRGSLHQRSNTARRPGSSR
jgi:hypothetical protein